MSDKNKNTNTIEANKEQNEITKKTLEDTSQLIENVHKFVTNKNSSGSFQYKTWTIEARLPTIADKVLIATRKSKMTDGHYGMLVAGLSVAQIEAANLVDAICSIEQLCKMPKDKDFPLPDNLIKAEANEDIERVILDIYEIYLKWSDFFRNKLSSISKE